MTVIVKLKDLFGTLQIEAQTALPVLGAEVTILGLEFSPLPDRVVWRAEFPEGGEIELTRYHNLWGCEWIDNHSVELTDCRLSQHPLEAVLVCLAEVARRLKDQP